MSHSPSTTDIDRDLTPNELELVHWLLEHGDSDNSVFIEQLRRARVTRLCSCGCASIDFSIDGKQPEHFAMRVLSDFAFRTKDGHLCGAFVFEQDGQLGGLDLWSIDGGETPDILPTIETLVPYESLSQV